MKNTNKQGKRFFLITACIILILGLFSCNSGGGDDNGITNLNASSEGVSSPAPLSEANVTDLAMEAFDITDIADTTSVLSGLSTAMKSVSDKPSSFSIRDLRRVASSAAEDIQGLDFEAMSEPAGKSVYNDTIDGPASGSATISITVDDATGDFSGSFTYNSFDDYYETISGSLDFSGNINVSTKVINSIAMTFNSITMSGEGYSIRVWGSFSMTVQGVVTTSTFNMSAVEDTSGYAQILKDYVVTLTKVSTYYSTITYSETFSGRFGDSLYGGYVDVTTETAFMVNATKNYYTNTYNFGYPYKGVLVMTGAGNTSARLTALSSSTYQIVADTNGDGTNDYDSGVQSWYDYEEEE